MTVSLILHAKKFQLLHLPIDNTNQIAEEVIVSISNQTRYKNSSESSQKKKKNFPVCHALASIKEELDHKTPIQ